MNIFGALAAIAEASVERQESGHKLSTRERRKIKVKKDRRRSIPPRSQTPKEEVYYKEHKTLTGLYNSFS